VNAIRVKICGITSVADAQIAVKAGADAIGLVFYAPSPRAVSIAQAREIAASVGPFVTVVGLFVDADEAFIREVLANVALHVLQFHGDESREFCEQFQRPYMKAIRMRPELDVVLAIAEYPSAVAILLDAYRPGVPGGTGETFDWQRVLSGAIHASLWGGCKRWCRISTRQKRPTKSRTIYSQRQACLSEWRAELLVHFIRKLEFTT
jgi:phosphoribosylanthranilate isomerase